MSGRLRRSGGLLSGGLLSGRLKSAHRTIMPKHVSRNVIFPYKFTLFKVVMLTFTF